jgi:hypothetical protein
MEFIALDVERFHLGITDFDTLLVGRGIERALNFQAGFGRCRSDQLDYRHAIDEWPRCSILFHFDVPGG